MIIRGFFAEKSTEGSNSSSPKQPQTIYRNKSGQFTSPPDGSKPTKTVNISRRRISLESFLSFRSLEGRNRKLNHLLPHTQFIPLSQRTNSLHVDDQVARIHLYRNLR